MPAFPHTPPNPLSTDLHDSPTAFHLPSTFQTCRFPNPSFLHLSPFAYTCLVTIPSFPSFLTRLAILTYEGLPFLSGWPSCLHNPFVKREGDLTANGREGNPGSHDVTRA
ncbi:hypothetical protein PAXRUDRAFT_374369 [Paxillus rubicundulus Ve08.2h10]|uniref:Uncharacterized protein n=1 Tax=Paxillus rubicundulus Ve08.2h10 TaxID=930991 RepID=A0A0D0D1V9_9AGAM|nr:hypothetical protein PAXRUDRAFT_374369 [Paxillus rubicundulus Ve08.2h10]